MRTTPLELCASAGQLSNRPAQHRPSKDKYRIGRSVNLLSLAQFALVPSCAARIQGIKLTKVSQLSLSETRVDWRRLATLARSGATNRVTTEGARNSCDFNARVRFLSLSVEGVHPGSNLLRVDPRSQSNAHVVQR